MEPYYGQIMMFGGNFAPKGWLLCQGQLLSISDNQTLFSIIGTYYGGDGRSTFALPDLRGRVTMGIGSGPGLSPRNIGQRFGAENHTLITAEIPSHSHMGQLNVSDNDSTVGPAFQGATIGTPGDMNGRTFSPTLGYNSATPNTPLNNSSVRLGNTGGGTSHNNIQPSSVINFIIANSGIYPPRD